MEPAENQTKIKPQPGPQETFLSSPADIAIYGGAAGGGKTWGLLLEPIRHISNSEFSAVFFRKTAPDIRNPGGPWDESLKLFGMVPGARPTDHNLEWHFSTGSKVKFSHLQYDKDALNWQGAQVPLLLFDELTHFSYYQFFYLLSRNRSMCGVRPYIRASCNPDPDSWVATFIDWWIEQDETSPNYGLPIPERAGVLRYFVRDGDLIVWASSPKELTDKYPLSQPKSVTFIPAKIEDNQALMKADPGYISNLMALPLVERSRLLGGNWKIRPAAGLHFNRSWVEVVDRVPDDLSAVRYWDLAATQKTDSNNPDWTVGVKMGYSPSQEVWFILDVIRMRESSHSVEMGMKGTAEIDGKDTTIGIPQDPGQAGKAQVRYLTKMLAGYMVKANRETGDKITRFGPASAQFEAGNIKILRGRWNDAYMAALEGVPDFGLDDADATSGAFEMMTGSNFFDLLEMAIGG